MIVGINHLRHFGIFRDFDGTKIKRFGRYNLIYGWNGTGKSTLSNLFSSIELRAVLPRFGGGQFSLSLEDGSMITDKNVSGTSLNIQTFNQSFIHQNIEWDKAVKSILLIAKEKIEDVRKLDNLKAELAQKSKFHGEKSGEAAKIRDALEKFMTNSAKKMKLGLQSIDTSDSYYLNYDRRKLASFIKDHQADVLDAKSVLDEAQVIDLTNAAKPDQLAAIVFASNVIDLTYFKKAAERIRNLIGTTAENQAIQRLADNPDIRDWVQVGLEIHKIHGSEKCEFCSSPFTAARAEALAAHFSKEFTEFQGRLESAATWIESQGAPSNQLPAASDFYKEFSADFDVLRGQYEAVVEKINTQVAAW